MLPRFPVAVAAFLFVFPAARVAVAGDPLPPQQNLGRKVGDWVIFRADIPKGAQVADLFLRTTLEKKAVAFWQPGKTLTVLDSRFTDRVSFSEGTRSFNISSLRVEDGELYQLSISPQEPTETVINSYRLSVFNINVTANKLENTSCSLALLCQAGLGPRAIVTYTWKTSASGPALAHGSRLQVVLDPKDKGASYTCTADVKAFQSHWDVTPYTQFCTSGVAGLFRPGFGALSCFALFVPMLATLLMLP